MDMDICMDIHTKFVDMDIDGKFHYHGNSVGCIKWSVLRCHHCILKQRPFID